MLVWGCELKSCVGEAMFNFRFNFNLIVSTSIAVSYWLGVFEDKKVQVDRCLRV